MSGVGKTDGKRERGAGWTCLTFAFSSVSLAPTPHPLLAHSHYYYYYSYLPFFLQKSIRRVPRSPPPAPAFSPHFCFLILPIHIHPPSDSSYSIL